MTLSLAESEALFGRMLDGAMSDEDIATVRVESPWFIDHLQLARLDGRWVVVNALWRRKPRT